MPMIIMRSKSNLRQVDQTQCVLCYSPNVRFCVGGFHECLSRGTPGRKRVPKGKQDGQGVSEILGLFWVICMTKLELTGGGAGYTSPLVALGVWEFQKDFDVYSPGPSIDCSSAVRRPSQMRRSRPSLFLPPSPAD